MTHSHREPRDNSRTGTDGDTGIAFGLDKLVSRYPKLSACRAALSETYRLCVSCFSRNGRLLICGNGGSAADAEHIVGELMKGYLKPRPVPPEIRKVLEDSDPENGPYLADHLQGTLPAIALTGHPALSTAFANDVAPDMVFAQQVYGYGSEGDLLLAITTSGNSRNVLNAIRVAGAKGIPSITLTGGTGGAAAQISTVAVVIPEHATPRIQELHLPVYHWLCESLEERFF
jgi:D-sedoheptulose 7-phosphate isomerase